MSDWKFDVDDVGEDGDASGEGDDTPTTFESMEEPVEPGSPSTENAVFVLLGVATTVFVFLRLLGVA
ncbi:DUF7312 domain-containing protein [Haladaptatus sp. NG-WS-4]